VRPDDHIFFAEQGLALAGLGRVATNFWFAYGASSPSNSTEYYYNTLGQLTNITERSGDDASSTYVASIGSPGTGNRVPRYVAALNRFRATPPEVLGDASAFALTAFTLGLIALTGLAKRRVTAECLNRGFRGFRGFCGSEERCVDHRAA
jgi:hypothetical protein